MRIDKVSIDEMARDARILARPFTLENWSAKFRAMLAAYGYTVAREGKVYFQGRYTILDDWDITPPKARASCQRN